jgi:hypothetical protein
MLRQAQHERGMLNIAEFPSSHPEPCDFRTGLAKGEPQGFHQLLSSVRLLSALPPASDKMFGRDREAVRATPKWTSRA